MQLLRVEWRLLEFLLQHGANAYNKDEDVSRNLALWLSVGYHKQLTPAQECVCCLRQGLPLV